jgi:hypothetical protein
MLRTARTTEEHAAEGGKLVQLELAPRFARPLAAFATKPGSDEEGGR